MISGASIDRCVRILLTTFYHMHHYTMQLLGRWSRVHYNIIASIAIKFIMHTCTHSLLCMHPPNTHTHTHSITVIFKVLVFIHYIYNNYYGDRFLSLIHLVLRGLHVVLCACPTSGLLLVLFLLRLRRWSSHCLLDGLDSEGPRDL